MEEALGIKPITPILLKFITNVPAMLRKLQINALKYQA